MANNIIVDDENDSQSESVDKHDSLVAWVMEHVEDWTDYREANYKSNWEEYYRLWRGIWKSSDKTRDSERSRLIVPALQQAIESSVSELEEATFGKGLWFDVVDDYADPEKDDVQSLRRQLHEDFEFAKVPGAISEAFLNGSLYGTGIGKIIVEEIEKKRPASRPQEDGSVLGGVESYTQFQVLLEPVDPKDFCIDPAARSIDDALGCAQTVIKPKHSIIAKQNEGIYLDGDIDGYEDDMDVSGLGESKDSNPEDKVQITEYAGLVPRELLPLDLEDDEEEVDLFGEDGVDYDETDLVEALVTIANGATLLKAVENPYMMQDRPFIAYQHDRVPNRFWGRGIAEKGYNPQKALDAELRARIDAMALSAHPMLAIDATRLPRGFRPQVGPGKQLLTNGNPRETLMPFQFNSINPATFTESGELERMIQMGTGSMDSATPVGISPRNSTASGMSMMMSGAIKRSKRTLKNIELYFLRPLIEKAAWRYMQFDPERYPVKDYKFLPKTTIGIMAREYEQQQLTNLLGMVPQDSPIFGLIIKGIFDNSSLENKDQLIKALDEMNQPKEPTPEEQQAQQMQQQLLQLELQEKQANIESTSADAQSKQIKAQADTLEAQADMIEAQAKQQSTQLDEIQVRAATALSQAQAVKTHVEAALEKTKIDKTLAESALAEAKEETERMKSVVDMYKLQLESMKLSSSNEASRTNANTTALENQIKSLTQTVEELQSKKKSPVKIERDKNGIIVSIDGKKPKRNAQGLIEEL